MIRRIIHINEDACNGCGLCAKACHEGAIAMVDGKARLIREDYCDGLGDCLPTCPTGAISFEEREAAAYDEAAVRAHLAQAGHHAQPSGACPGSRAATIAPSDPGDASGSACPAPSQLRQWPVQLKLAPIHAPYFEQAHLLIAADCAAYAYGAFHQDFMHGKVTLIGCPKLDAVNYAEKLTEILKGNDIQSLTLVRMEVPCCGGLERMAASALEQSKKKIPFRVVTLSTSGKVLSSDSH